MQKIYLVEDDATIVSVLADYLRQWGYECYPAKKFAEILQEFRAVSPDLVLLDISLPYYNGYHWCQEIRNISEVPIIFLSSMDQQMNQIMAMNMGADDYLTKPFDLVFVLAKIQALLRRSYQYTHQQVQTFSLGEVTFHPIENLLKSKTESLPLSPNESRILSLLLQQQGKIVPKETIIEMLWNSEEFIDNNTLAVNMTRLRKKLSQTGLSDLIQTVKNKGYLIEKEQAYD
ncbi:response regulator transcription factor [Enterococcus gallinarum]|uniref:Response regulators consisting of a CheY-like receiver domain and a winged-helix DNA-binding domain n=1 Tax=Enterococcus gallinarum TaxID=1353 RepID=A0A376H1G4_ENTGA|nr:response regulator transcription factor [Enterococcus gallinarum]OJG48566.1 PhoB family transcriptional regulator [Enterococcus gallinarum]STD73122.1 Response regulators consisting of a CheY-like receiver domain and a winged-helix DNA-binding domain [Enterococcus gallinarum]STD82248.1 Response regulators consisting of a CheY-like receiver domain and a winged-helix DNA-binding domain [Enterococcus gallinarum]